MAFNGGDAERVNGHAAFHADGDFRRVRIRGKHRDNASVHVR